MYHKTHNPVQTNMIQMNQVVADRSEEDEISLRAVKEIVEAQKADAKLKHFFKRNAVLDKGLELQLVNNGSCMCNKRRLVIQAIATACNHVVSPLSSAPKAYSSQRDNESCDILERNEISKRQSKL
jgi:hypothetical protein